MTTTTPSVRRPARIPLGLLLLMGTLAAIGPFSIDMYLPALPDIGRALVATPDRVQATLAAYFAGLAAGQLVLGPLADRYGRKPPLIGGLVLYVIASLGCAVAPTIEALLVMRFFQAFGACAGMVASRAVLRDLFDPRDMARALSLVMLVMGIAPIIAPMVGSGVGTLFGWPAIFVTLAIYGALTLGATGLGLQETLPSDTRRPLQIGRILRTYGGLFGQRQFMTYAIAGGVAQAGMFAYIASSSFVFIEVFDLGQLAFSLVFGGNALGLIFASQVNERLLRTRSPRAVLPVVFGVYVLATAVLLASAITGIGGLVGIIVPLFVSVSCLGFCFPNTTAAAMAPVGDRAGSAAALLGTLQYGIAGLSSFLSGLFFAESAVSMAAMMFGCAALASLALATTLIPGLAPDTDAEPESVPAT